MKALILAVLMATAAVAQTPALKKQPSLAETIKPMVTARAFVLAVARNQDVKDCSAKDWTLPDEHCSGVAVAIMRTFVQDKAAGAETPKASPPTPVLTVKPWTQLPDAAFNVTSTVTTLTMADPHGCNYIAQWDAETKVCAMHFMFSADMTPPITCSPVAKDGDHQAMVCWYTPKPTPEPTK